MTRDEFISLVRRPESVDSAHLAELKEMIESYPYFAHPRMFLAKISRKTNNLQSKNITKLAVLYGKDRRWLYYYLNPEQKLTSETYRPEREPRFSGNYFDILNVVESEGGDAKQSLKNLAQRLKSAREMITVSTPVTPQSVKKPIVIDKSIEVELDRMHDYFDVAKLSSQTEMGQLEDTAKKLIKEKKYEQAIEILKKLNLNNPKKSVYFADQIRFLEKVIANTKK